MAVFKCKMCGGELDVCEGISVAECPYCGIKQTLPRLDNERKINLYDRAADIYEKILEEDKEDSETYWSLLLCHYGVEYVEDPETHKRVSTINRAQYTSVFLDEDYQKAIEYADGYQKDVYQEEAKTIDDIQKGILEISNKQDITATFFGIPASYSGIATYILIIILSLLQLILRFNIAIACVIAMLIFVVSVIKLHKICFTVDTIQNVD